MSKSSHLREKDKIMLYVFVPFEFIFFSFFVFPCLRVILFAPYFDVIFGEEISSKP